MMEAVSAETRAKQVGAAPASGGRVVVDLLALGLFLGLVYGFIEGGEVSLLRLIPGALSWRTGNSSYVLWFAPLFYALCFGALTLVIALVAMLAPRLSWQSVAVFLFSALGAFLALTLPGRPLSDLAAGVLALGAAAEMTRQFAARRARVTSVVRRTLPYLAGLALLLAAVLIGGTRMREAWAVAQLPAGQPGRPNVLLLIIDTQRADHLSLYGYGRRTSPNLDAFARDALVFDNAYATSSWTLPTHASIMTGQPLHVHRAGLMRRPYLGKGLPTMAEVFAQNGYATGGFVANTFWTGRQTGIHRGFVRYEDFWGNAGDAMARTALGRRLAYDVLPRFGLRDVPGRKYADELNRDLLHWLDRVDGRPFFAFVNYFDVHGPHLPRAPFGGTYSPIAANAGRKGMDIGALTADVVVPAREELSRMIDRYDESILYIDDQLGRLFQQLKARGVLDNTIIVLTSDHGESWGEHGMMYHGHSLYREQLHVPLLVRFPARLTPQRISRPVSVEQIPATLTTLTGIAPSAFPQATLMSDTVHAVLAEVGRRSTVAANWPSSRGWVASLLTQQWQFIRYQDAASELFDLTSDPAQLNNRAGSDPATASALQHELDQASPAGQLNWRR